MTEPDDMQLLRQYAGTNSEDAFAALVQRHVNLVYSVALRHTGDSHKAQDVTQAVFIILARKAASLCRETVLTGWLYQTARFTATSFLRCERRRQHREQESYMQSTLDQSPSDAAWEQLSPLLDDAMGRLGKLDRNLLLLRFFEGKSSTEAAAALNLNEPAAKRRCTRAIEKLRGYFSRRGVDSTTDTITETISTHSIQIAPATLAKTVTAAALAKGATASVSTLTIIKGALQLMAWTKIKTAAVVGVVAIFTVSTATVTVKQFVPRLFAAAYDNVPVAKIAADTEAKYTSLTSYSDEGVIASSVAGHDITTAFTIKLVRTNLYWIDWRQDMGFSVLTGAVWSAGNGHFLKAQNINQNFPDAQKALATASGVSGGATGTIPGIFFQQANDRFRSVMQKVRRLPDERVGNVDCYVLTAPQKSITLTFWIGKQDSLIHRVRSDMAAAVLKAALQAAAKKNPQLGSSISPQDVTMIETHSNIVVDTLTPLDFQQLKMNY